MKVALQRPPRREFSVANLARTTEVAGAVAASARVGDVIALWGDLGAGKTAFARAFIQARAGSAIEVPSPTFTLVQVYELESGPIWHFDCYRLKRPAEVYELGFEDALAQAIVLVEWPERLANLLPGKRLDIRLTYGAAAEARQIVLEGAGTWRERLSRLPISDE
jgi:tRNA threonylcarbamoyladenosine biosynthesis protein TsaE